MGALSRERARAHRTNARGSRKSSSALVAVHGASAVPPSAWGAASSRCLLRAGTFKNACRTHRATHPYARPTDVRSVGASMAADVATAARPARHVARRLEALKARPDGLVPAHCRARGTRHRAWTARRPRAQLREGRPISSSFGASPPSARCAQALSAATGQPSSVLRSATSVGPEPEVRGALLPCSAASPA